jgi:four helix bundle protein
VVGAAIRNSRDFVSIAMGSTYELEYQFLLSRDLGYLDTGMHQAFEERVTEIKMMMTALIQRIQGSK